MDFKEYQDLSKKTAVYKDDNDKFYYLLLGLCGESGEVAEKGKKIIRDMGKNLTEEKKKELEKELGDVLWYISQLATELGLNLDDLAKNNLDKLFSRNSRGALHGDGDNR